MSHNLVNLNVNPCKMCMPMGAVSALYGIKGCMSILHGSQGCATYIRRHMATHYNEPVDIASSSLTEQGTVFGGERNLLKGIDNLIELYHPEVIGIATTCLAETIGEDVGAIIKKYEQSHPENIVKLINVSSAGYAGTQYEGFFASLRAVVEQTEMSTDKNGSINIITPMISPADYRYLKSLLDEMGINYILLPDLSENLDGVHTDKYERLKTGGTSLKDISKMAGASFTIELSEFISDSASPALYLYEKYAVPFERIPLPTGIEHTDTFIKKLSSLGGTVTEKLKSERGRYLDAMVDSHKYCAEGRAAIFGEPDFVAQMTKLCCENGTVPVLAATGSVCHDFSEKLLPMIKKAAEPRFIKDYAVLDDCDFDKIEALCQELKVNLLIGSSDGRRVSHKLNIDLVRCAFPIHDRVGGQRIRTIGYDGSLFILDQIANIMLGNKEKNFREEIYKKFFGENKEELKNDMTTQKTIEEKTQSHPCYNCGGGNARIHLPVAPKCNIQCNYCVRKYDCPNESRPGVTTEVLTPQQAFNKYAIVKKKFQNLTVAGIAGPGDALANFEETKKTLQLIREYDSKVTFCLSTNGLMLPLYADELISLGVSHVTVTMNAVDPEIGAKIYSHVDYMGKRYFGLPAASILLANQLSGLKMLVSKGIICKVNCVVLKGINDEHIEEVVKTAEEIGVYITNIMQLIPVAGSAFESMGQISNKEINEIRKKCEAHVKQMYHCRQCRADAIGTLDNNVSIEYRGCSSCGEKKTIKKQKFAIATKSGILVDQHFGQATEFYIYESDGETSRFIEKRQVEKYCTGKEECGDKESKIDNILSAVSDCDCVIAMRIGDSPSKKFADMGIKTVLTYDRIESAIFQAALK